MKRAICVVCLLVVICTLLVPTAAAKNANPLKPRFGVEYDYSKSDKVLDAYIFLRAMDYQKNTVLTFGFDPDHVEVLGVVACPYSQPDHDIETPVESSFTDDGVEVSAVPEIGGVTITIRDLDKNAAPAGTTAAGLYYAARVLLNVKTTEKTTFRLYQKSNEQWYGAPESTFGKGNVRFSISPNRRASGTELNLRHRRSTTKIVIVCIVAFVILGAVVSRYAPNVRLAPVEYTEPNYQEEPQLPPLVPDLEEQKIRERLRWYDAVDKRLREERGEYP